MKTNSKSDGYTLIEMILTLGLLSILAASAVISIISYTNSSRLESTKKKMEALYIAIMGADIVDPSGQRKNFGYLGDMGLMPYDLTGIYSQGTLPTWVYNSTYRMGYGWRGPYLSSQFTGAQAFTKDDWGTNLVYTTAGTPTLTSYGANKIAGGSAFDTDIVIPFPASRRLATTVKGIVTDRTSRYPSVTVVLGYTAGGTLATASTTTDANGAFSFSSIPFGFRSVLVNSYATSNAFPITVDRDPYVVPPIALDYLGTTGVTYVAASATTTPVATYEKINFNLQTRYPSLVTLKYVTVFFSKPAFLKSLMLNGAQTETFACLTSGVRTMVTTTLSLTADTNNHAGVLTFAPNPDCTGTVDMRDTTIQILYEWDLPNAKDSITFVSP